MVASSWDTVTNMITEDNTLKVLCQRKQVVCHPITLPVRVTAISVVHDRDSLAKLKSVKLNKTGRK